MFKRLAACALSAVSLFVFITSATAQSAPPIINTATLANWDVNLGGYNQSIAVSSGVPPYTWTVSTGTLPPQLGLNSATGTISGTPTQVGTFPFSIMVTDARSQTASKGYTVTINQQVSINNAPGLPGGAVGETYVQAGSQLGAAWGTGQYTWSVPPNTLPAGLSLNSNTGAITGIATAAGNYQNVNITATDTLGQTATTAFSVTINPQLAIAPVTLPVGVAGIAYNGPGLQTSGGSAGVSWSLAAGTISNGTLAFQPGGNFSGTPTTAQMISVTAKVTDRLGGTATMPVSFTINPPLSITTTANQIPTAVQNYPYNFQIQTAGGSGGLGWVVSSGALPPGININASGVLTGSTSAAPGGYAFQLRATDSDNENALSPMYTLVMAPPVTITTTALPNGGFGDTYSQAIATNGGTGNFTWSISAGALPTGVGINPTTGLISGTATMPNGFPPNVAEQVNVTVQVLDSVGDTATQAFGFLINPTLAVSTTIAPAAVQGDVYSAALGATGGSGTFTWSITPANALPTGLSLTDPVAGVISGTASVTGSFPFTATVTDSNGGTANKALTLYVNAAGKLITSNLLPGMTIVNVSGTQDGAGSYNNGQTIWYSPFSTTQHLLEYTVQPGTYTFRVIDPADAQAIFPSLTAGQATSMWTSWTYNSPWITSYLVFDSSAATNSSVGQIFSGSENGAGVTNPPTATPTTAAYNLALSNGTYNELFVGTRNSQTPVKQYHFANTETLIFAVPDNDPGDNGGGVSVLIAPVEPTLSIPGENTITSLPAGQAGTAYTPVTLTAAGGSGVYQWSNSSTNGPLPAGMTISPGGVIGGTPTVMGTFARVLFVATDPVSGASQGVLYSLQITGPANPLTITTSSPLPEAQVNTLYSQTIHATGGLGAYTWSMTPIGNASGLSINASTGAVSGMIATPGTYSFTVTVTDAATDMAQGVFTVSELGITISVLPSAIQGESYNQLVPVAGATGSVTWTVSAGALPAGLQLVPSTGDIVGVPTSLNNAASFSVTATDSANNTTFKLFSIPVSRPAQVSYMLVDRNAGLVSISDDGSNTATFDGSSAGGYDIAQEAGGNFIVAAASSLLRVTPQGSITTVVQAPVGSQWIAAAIDGTGNIITVDNLQHAVWRVSPDGSSIVEVANYPAPLPASLENAKVLVDTHGNYIVAEDNGGAVRIFVVTPGGSPAEVSLSTVPVTVGGFTFDHTGNYILEDSTENTLYQITPGVAPPGGTTTAILAGVSGMALARNPVTNVYGVASNGAMAEITGTHYASLFSGSPLFHSPRGMVAVTSDFVSAVDATNPLGYFRLEATSGVSEVNGLPYQFTLSGATLTGSGAPIGEATSYVSLDGNSGSVGTGAAGNIGTAGSVMAWVNLAALPSCDPACNAGQQFRYVAGESFGGNDFDLQFSNDNVLRFYTTNGGANISYTPNPATLTGQWHMIVTTFDAGATPPTRAIYWDGQLVAQDNTASLTNKPGSFEIGASNVFPGRNFHGGIDEVGLWNYSLTPGEVYRMFAETSGIFGLASAPTVLSLLPNTTPVNSASVALIVTGQNLSSTTGVWWTPAGGQTTVLGLTGTAGNTLVTATVPGSLLTATGSAEVSVVTGSVPSNQLPFTISGPQVSISTTSLPSGTQFQPYMASVAATGGSGHYSWSITSEDSGFHLVIDNSGNLTGTPTNSNTDGGLSLTVQVTDTTTNLTASHTFFVVVAPGFPPAPGGPQPAGTSAYVLDETGAISSVTGGVSRSLANFNGCNPTCSDMARDATGRFVVASGNALLVLAPSGQLSHSIGAPEGARYFSVAVDSTGNYIVADTGNHQLLRIAPGSGSDTSVTSLVGSWTPAGGSVSENAFVRIDGTGKYILTVDDQDESDDQPAFRLFTSTSQGPLVPVTITGGAQPVSTGGLTFDANGNYVDTDWWHATVYTITPAGASTQLYSNPGNYLSTPRGIARDPMSGDFLLVDDDLDALYTLTPDGLQLNLVDQYDALGVPGSVIVANTIAPHAIDYVLTDSDPTTIVPVGGGTALTCSACSGFASDFAADAQGNFIVASSGALVKITPGGGACPQGCIILTPVNGQSFSSVAIDRAGNYIVVDNNLHQVLKVAPGLPGTITGTIPYTVDEDEGDSFEDAYVRIDAAGNYVVAEDNDEDNPISIFVIPPTATSSPAPLTLTPGLPLTSIPTTLLGGMTLDATGRYVLTDDDSNQIYVVSQAGAFNILYGNQGNIFSELEGIYLDPLSGNFLLTDYGNDILYTMDQAGTQVTLVQSGLNNAIAALSYPTTLTVISSTTLPGGTANQFYSTGFMAQGGSGNYTWSATGLPGTLSMSAAGVISGTPTAAFSSNNIVVTVTDTSNNNTTAMKTFSLTIVPGASPLPVISGLAPSSARAGGPAFTLTVNGSNFVSGATVEWGATALTTTFVSATQLTASVSVGQIASAGPVNVTVVDPGPLTSGASTFTVNPSTVTTTTLLSSATPSVFGQAVTLTANISPAAATGKVTFYDGTSVLGIGTVTGGIAHVTTSLLPAGSGTLKAYYAGDVNYAPSTAVPAAQTVNANPSGTLTTQAAGSPFLAGFTPCAVTTGDFNGDGIPDLAVVNNEADNVAIFLGAGAGVFNQASGSPHAAGTGPCSVAVADFNRDGIQDIAIGNQNTNNITVLLGSGQGIFSPAPGSPFPAGSNPFVTVGDFNGDGIPDLATANFGGNNVTVLLGDGLGNFNPAQGSPFPAGASPVAIVVGDFNGDGKADIATANFGGNNVTVLLGNGAGGFGAAQGSPFPAGTSPRAIAIGNFRAGQISDLAIANESGNNVTVLLGTGLGGFNPAAGSPFPAGTNPFSVAVGDLNGDGIQDLAFANDSTNSVTVLLGTGGGVFTTAPGNPLATDSSPVSVVVGDFNGDGRADLAVANEDSNDVTILLGGLAATNSLLSTTSPASIMPGTAVALTLAVSDSGTAFKTPTGTVTFSDGTTVLGTAAQSASPYTFSATGLAAGSHTFTASYGGDSRTASSASNSVVITVGPSATQPLSITSGAPPNGMVNAAYGPFTLTASGGSGSYLWAVGGVSGVGVNGASGVLSGTPTASGNLTLTVTLTDAGNTSSSISQNYSVSIAAAGLTITTSSLPGGIQNSAYSASLAGSGGSGSYNWAISGITGLTVNASTGALGGSPTVGGNLTLNVTLSDALNPSATPATRQYAVTITFAPLTIKTPGALGEFAPNAAISTTFAATGGSPAFTWSATGVPATLTLTPATGQITGNAPAKPGNYSFPLKVSDTETPAASDSTTVTLSVLGITTPATLPSGTTSTTYSLNFIAMGGTPPYTFSSPNVPAGLTLSSSGFLNGTPAKPITSSFQVLVTDASGISPVSGTFSLTVASGVQAIQVSGAALPDGTLTTSYSQPLEAQNGKPSYNWTLLGGTLPPGLALSSAGTISGTPTAAGTAMFTARATDSAGGFAAGVFSINVNPAALQVTAAALPNAMAALPYGAQPINATGGFPPYSFAITQGSLPSPLTFSNGQINNGVPAAAGTAAFTVTATDAVGNTASGSFTLVVEPTHPDLILSQGSVSFAIVTGAVTLPPAANVTVGSSVAASLGYTVQVNPPAPWLDVTPNSSTPGAVIIGLDAANAPPLGIGIYQTTVTVACPPVSGCTGSHDVAVSLAVTSPAPQLSVGSNLISFSATGNGSQTLAQPLNLQNSGGGVVTIQSVTAADRWVKFDPATIPPPPMPLAAGQTLQVNVFADTTVLSGPGYYQSTITVTTDAGSATVPVTLLIAANATMTLAPAGSQFNAVAGNAPGNSNGSFLVAVSGSSTVNWTAAILSSSPAATWLTLNTPSGSSTSGNPGAISFSINGAATGLAAQPYYATIEVTVTGSGVVTDPVQDYQVVLNVAAAGNILAPNPDPSGLIFISTGAGALPAQIVSVGSSAPYTAQSDSPSWLSVKPAAAAGQSSVSANPAGLSNGVYHGGVSYAIAGQVRTVNVTLIVAVAAAGHSIPDITGKAVSPGCTATQIIPTQTGLVSNFSLPTAWPTPLRISVVDDCGNAVTAGQVVATFSNGDPPLVLPGVGGSAGVYSGTWTPRATASQVTILAQASAQGFKPATVQITGQVTRNGAPVLNPGGTLNAFVPVVGSPLAPGMIVQIYGSNLASQVAVGSTIPLVTSLNNTTVIIGGIAAPLYYVSPGQINAQVPFELSPGASYQVIVNANGALSTPNPVQLAGDAPGIAAFASGGIIAEHGADGSLVTEASPAAPGEYIVFFVSGMGSTTNPVASGQPSPGNPNLAVTTDPPALTLNGANVPVSFAGLTPTLVGLYQVDFQVPANTPNGDLQLVLTQTGGASNSTILPVHN